MCNIRSIDNKIKVFNLFVNGHDARGYLDATRSTWLECAEVGAYIYVWHFWARTHQPACRANDFLKTRGGEGEKGGEKEREKERTHEREKDRSGNAADGGVNDRVTSRCNVAVGFVGVDDDGGVAGARTHRERNRRGARLIDAVAAMRTEAVPPPCDSRNVVNQTVD